MDAAGAGGAAQPIAAGGRGGVPMDLPREYVSHWQDWDGAKGNLAFELVGGILALKPTAKLLVTYAPFISLCVADGELHAKCVLQGCTTKAASVGVRITYDNKVQMCNLIEHLWRVHGGTFLTAADYAERKVKEEGTKKKRKADAEETGSPLTRATPTASLSGARRRRSCPCSFMWPAP